MVVHGSNAEYIMALDMKKVENHWSILLMCVNHTSIQFQLFWAAICFVAQVLSVINISEQVGLRDMSIQKQAEL